MTEDRKAIEDRNCKIVTELPGLEEQHKELMNEKDEKEKEFTKVDMEVRR